MYFLFFFKLKLVFDFPIIFRKKQFTQSLKDYKAHPKRKIIAVNDLIEGLTMLRKVPPTFGILKGSEEYVKWVLLFASVQIFS